MGELLQHGETLMARRRHGTGTVYRQNGRWMGAIDLGRGDDGRRQRKRVVRNSRLEVQGKLAKIQARIARGRHVRSERLTVGDILDQWLAALEVRENTLAGYRSVVDAHLRPAFGHVHAHVEELRASDVQQFVQRKRRTLSSRSTQRIRQALSSALKWAMLMELIDRNVASITRAPRYVPREVEPLTTEEVGRFLKAVQGDRLEPLWHVAIGMGLRQSELLGLRWEDVDWSAQQFTVCRTGSSATGSAAASTSTTRRPSACDGWRSPRRYSLSSAITRRVSGESANSSIPSGSSTT